MYRETFERLIKKLDNPTFDVFPLIIKFDRVAFNPSLIYTKINMSRSLYFQMVHRFPRTLSPTR